MSGHKEAAEELEKQVKEAFPNATTRLEVLAGCSCLDVIIPEYQPKEWTVIFVYVRGKTPASPDASHQSPGVEYGFSIVDKDTGYGTGADCSFGYVPVLIKYMKRLFPLIDMAKLAYNTLTPHPGNKLLTEIGEPERVCRVCGYTFERDTTDCPGAILRAAMRT